MQSIRPATSARRFGALVGPALIGALVLSSCGSGESGATSSTVDLNSASTAFVVRPPATTVPIDTAAAGDPDAVVEGTQDYTVVFGDYWYGLVERFAVSIDDLLAVNEWTDINTFPNPGDVILIPPGAKSVAAVGTGTTDPAAATGDTATDDTSTDDTSVAAPAETIPDAGDNCAPGSYTIVADDFEGKVASKFDVTVDALRTANAATSGYSSFYVGLEIVIPAKSDC